jgi:glycosyltransferase involved in cell wall biosynthesis
MSRFVAGADRSGSVRHPESGIPSTMTRTTCSVIWIDWARNLRTRSLAQRLGVEVLEIRMTGNRLLRYVRSAARTVAAISRMRPEIVIATNPSLVLGFLLLLLRRWYGFVLVSDAHYVGVRDLHGWPFFQKLLDFHNSRADLVIVTNDGHANYLQSHGGRAYVCPDPLPDLSTRGSVPVTVTAKSVFLVCSFEADEPYEAVFAAFARLQDSGYQLYVSGNYRRAQVDPAQFPWVRFLGYVPEAEYYSYLRSCSVVLDLTTLEDCLVCGAYEAMAAGKPLVLSMTRALATYFGAAAMLTENTPDAIAANIEQAHAQRLELPRRVADWIASNERYMSERISTLKRELTALRGVTADESAT